MKQYKTRKKIISFAQNAFRIAYSILNTNNPLCIYYEYHYFRILNNISWPKNEMRKSPKNFTCTRVR